MEVRQVYISVLPQVLLPPFHSHLKENLKVKFNNPFTCKLRLYRLKSLSMIMQSEILFGEMPTAACTVEPV